MYIRVVTSYTIWHYSLRFSLFLITEQSRSLPGVQLQEKQQLVTPNPVNFTATLQAYRSFRGAKFEVFSDPDCSFQAASGLPLLAPLQLRARSQKWGLPLRLSNFLSFPLLPSTSPPLSPSPLTQLSSPFLTHSGGRTGTQAPILKVAPRAKSQWSRFPAPPGFVSYLPSSQGSSGRAIWQMRRRTWSAPKELTRSRHPGDRASSDQSANTCYRAVPRGVLRRGGREAWTGISSRRPRLARKDCASGGPAAPWLPSWALIGWDRGTRPEGGGLCEPWKAPAYTSAPCF